MDTELYEEAVRDYEKVYQTEKTSGVLLPYFPYFCPFIPQSVHVLHILMVCFYLPPQSTSNC